MLIYVLAVFHRSSLGVAGLVATERFDISATQLATFTMLQLLVYAGMQVPVGLLIDRFGPRSVLLCGLVLMTLAQAAFAFADNYAVALLARAFVGVGDAMTFICVLRLVSSWFPVRRIPIVTQLTGTLGQLGAVVAAIPMTWALGHLGWTPAYLGAAAIGVVLIVALLLLLGDAPGAAPRARSAALAVHGATEPLRLVGAARNPTGVLDALHLPVQRHHDEPALGLPVLRARRGPLDRDRRRSC